MGFQSNGFLYKSSRENRLFDTLFLAKKEDSVVALLVSLAICK